MMLKGREKAAAVLSLLGDELSQKILSYLPEEAAVSIISASENLQAPTREVLLGIVSEFNDYMLKPGGGEEGTKETKEPKPETVAAFEPGSPLDIINRASAAQLANVLQTERSEVAAYVLSHLPVEKVYEILALLKEAREAVESRLIAIKDVPIAKQLEDNILKSVSERLA